MFWKLTAGAKITPSEKHLGSRAKSTERPLFPHHRSRISAHFVQGESRREEKRGNRLEGKQLISILWHVLKLMSFLAHGFIFLAWRGYDARRKFKKISNRRSESAVPIQAGN